MFQLLKTSKISHARLTRLTTPHGTIDGPFFLPIATRGAVKHMAVAELEAAGAQIILANAYHLRQAPGMAVIRRAGGLHRFMGWPGPILTDSGGFQVFSLARFRQVSDRGVRFADPSSGKSVTLTARSAIKIQQLLGSDIMMVLDECVGYPASRGVVRRALERTTAWAKASRQLWPPGRGQQLLFGIIQGGMERDFRLQSCRELVALNFDGYAIGGLAVGERRATRIKILRLVTPQLPADKPRYVMGVGKPEEIVSAVRCGVDLFDCVIPTREARHGRLYVRRSGGPPSKGWRTLGERKPWYTTLNIRQAKNAGRFTPIDRGCRGACCQAYTLAYLRHLFKVGEPLGPRLATLHNVRFYLELMEDLRLAIRSGAL